MQILPPLFSIFKCSLVLNLCFQNVGARSLGGISHQLPREDASMSTAPKANVLLPLYIYPDPGAWTPLRDAITANPTLNFTVIINPHSGPGFAPWWPNVDYVREIPWLNAQPNVRTVGYVRTGYCKRSLNEVHADINQYANWPKDTSHPGLSVSGIFFDETPNQFSDATKQYLDTITKLAKQTTGILGDRLVIHNPGSSVNKKLADPGPDITTTFEESYANFHNAEHQKWLATSPYNATRSSYMLNGVPKDQVGPFTYELRQHAHYLFLTDLSANFYEQFGSSWWNFIAAMAAD